MTQPAFPRTRARPAAGPLAGLRVVEFAGIGPGPFAAMLLSDMGADVVRIDRPGAVRRAHDIPGRGRRSVALDLKQPADVAQALALLRQADALIEGFRPGVMERLGLGPDVVQSANPRLVYGRMTGWGQTGPLAHAAGHDINYIAITGALHAIGTPDSPVPPLNLVGDYGGGSLYLIVGILAALLEAGTSGRGQVVDCAISDNVVNLMATFYGITAGGGWHDRRAANMLDGGAHFYRTYRCADGKHLSVGAIEPQFYALLRQIAGMADTAFDAQRDQAAWPDLQDKAAAIFATKTRDEWTRLLEGTDACVAPVLSLAEAPKHPHLQARGSFVEVDGIRQPAPAPRFSRTPSAVQASVTDQDIGALLTDWGG